MSEKPQPLCEICGIKLAEYLCRDCKRLICRDDFDPDLNVCIECREKYIEYYPRRIISFSEARRRRLWKPTIVFIVGIILLFIGFAFIMYPETGLIYIIGPLPISTIILNLILMFLYVLLIIAVFLVFLKYFWRSGLY